MERRELLSAVAGVAALGTVGIDRGEAGNDFDGGRAEADSESDTIRLDIVLTDE